MCRSQGLIGVLQADFPGNRPFQLPLHPEAGVKLNLLPDCLKNYLLRTGVNTYLFFSPWVKFFFLFFFFLLFILYWGIADVVIVSGDKQRDSAIHMHVSILPQTPYPIEVIT